MNIRTFVAKSAIWFSENEGGGSKAVRNFSENSSVLVGLGFPKDANLEILKKTTDNVLKSNKCIQCDYASSHAGDLRNHLKKHSGVKSYKCNQCGYASSCAHDLRTHLKKHGKQMQSVWLYILLCKQFGDTFKNAQWKKVVQMQPMWLCILSGRQFEDTFENTQWRKVKQMQPMWLCILSCR